MTDVLPVESLGKFDDPFIPTEGGLFIRRVEYGGLSHVFCVCCMLMMLFFI